MQGIPQGQNSGNQGGSQKPSLSWQTPNTPTNKLAQADKQKSSGSAPAPKADKNQPQSISSMATYVGIFVAGLIVGVLLGWGIVSSREGTSSTATTTSQGATTTNTNTNTGSTLGTGDVVISASQPAGPSVAVSKINVGKPTWVVVYDNNAGAAGRALGATLFLPTAAGGESSGTIDLLRPTVAGTTYLVGQLVDDGDYNLSFSKDTAVLGTDGKPALMVLTAQ